MNEINALIEKSHRFLRSAELLWRDGDSASAVSRLYYAMFFSAEAALLTKGLSHSSHKGVLSAFGEHFVKSGIFAKEMGRNLNLAFEKRQLGDYECTLSFDEDEVAGLMNNATDFVEAVSTWLHENKLL